MRAGALLAVVASGLFLAPVPGRGQVPCSGLESSLGSHVEDDLAFGRLLQVSGGATGASFLLRKGYEPGVTPTGCALLAPLHDAPFLESGASLAIGLMPVRQKTEFHSTYPSDRNNGALWAGRGLSGSIEAGAWARWGPATLRIAPRLLYQGNQAFRIVPYQVVGGQSPFGHPWGGIDLPQRFGDESYWGIDPGSSSLQVAFRGFGVGASTAPMAWGPGARYPILMSPTGPGIPHVFVGTVRPVDLWIGQVEGQAIWGRLKESAYYDDHPANDLRLLAGLVGAFEPRWTPGLWLGLARSFLTYPDEYELLDYILQPYTDVRANPTGSSADNQLISIFFRWILPESGFEVYGEYARDDHWENFRDLVMEPDHIRGYMVGLQKVFDGADYLVRFRGETVNLNPVFEYLRPRGNFYTHSGIGHGYTNLGQMLGSWTGPSSDAQYLGVDVTTSRAVLGVFGERVRRNESVYYRRWAPQYNYRAHDAELIGGLHGRVALGAFSAGMAVEYAYRYNRDFLDMDLDGFVNPRIERNWGILMDLTWNPASFDLLRTK